MITHENTNNSKDLVFPFTDDQEFAVLQYIVPMQVLARKLSLDLGIDCNIPSDPQFHFKMNSYLKRRIGELNGKHYFVFAWTTGNRISRFL